MRSWCDRATYFFLCLLILVLPASIAGVSIFSIAVILFYSLKKILDFRVELKRNNGGARQSLAISLRPPNPVSSVYVPVFLFLLACYVSIFSSQFPCESLRGFIGKNLKQILLFFAIQESLTTTKRFRIVMWLLLASAFLICLDGFWQMKTGFDMIHRHLIDGRITATFKHPNDLAGYLMAVAPVALWSCCETWDRWRQPKVKGGAGLPLALTLLTVAVFITLGLTYSRGAWVGLALSLVVLTIFEKRYRLSIILGGAVFFFIFSPLLLQNRKLLLMVEENQARVASSLLLSQGQEASSIPESLERSRSSVPAEKVRKLFENILNGDGIFNNTGRTTFWRDALSMIKNHPIRGNGLNTYAALMKERQKSPQFYAHNCYLQMAAEIGIVGLGIYLWVLVSVTTFVIRRLKNLKRWEESGPLLALFAGWVGMIFHSAVDTTLYSVQLGAFFWMMMGLCVTLTAAMAQGEGKERERSV